MYFSMSFVQTLFFVKEMFKKLSAIIVNFLKKLLYYIEH